MALQKIIDIKGDDFGKGLSEKQQLAVGGLFATFQNIDPFSNSGVAKPSYTPTEIIPTYTPKFLTNFVLSSVSYVYAHSTSHLTQILRASPYTQVDATAKVTVTLPVIGAIVWKQGYVYGLQGGALKISNLSSTDVTLKAGFNSDMDTLPLCVGADGNLYHGDNYCVGIVTSATGTAGNSSLAYIDDGYQVRDVANDGTYLVIVADNNNYKSASRINGNFNTRVYFWDMRKMSSTYYLAADTVYDINEPYVSAVKILDGNSVIFGYNGIYVCNSATFPKLLRRYSGGNTIPMGRPESPYQVACVGDAIYWVDGGTTTARKHKVFAYGNSSASSQKIFFQPYLDTGADQLQTVLTTSGDQIWIGGDTPKIFAHNTTTTEGDSSITTIDYILSAPYRYEYTKVVLREPLSSGQTVTLNVQGQNGSKQLSASETKSYSASNPRQQLIFKRIMTGGSNNQLAEDVRLSIQVVGGATIQRITSYGTPLEDANETI